ncbi:MAG: RtcB family protein [Turicibacter sp.]|nr:RtcB family protein [Turicibacter sp.]
MQKVQGKFADAIVYTDALDEKVTGQIMDLLAEDVSKGEKIRIMPDVHSGKGCVIGLTMTLSDKVIPNLVGVDIGCGISGIRLPLEAIDFEQLESIITKGVPAGFAIRHHVHKGVDEQAVQMLDRLRFQHFDQKKALLSLGSLGGGNHFIEVGRDMGGHLWLFIHSGSRGIGNQVAQHYQKLAIAQQKERRKGAYDEIEAQIQQLKAEGRHEEIKAFLKAGREAAPVLNPDLAYLEGSLKDDYLHDAGLMQRYALLNRQTMIQVIVEGLGLDFDPSDIISVHHNYIDLEAGMVRKGAISAQAGEAVFIPMNMRDGMIVGRGKGNPDWNFSAPHGAGRTMSRIQAKKTVSMEAFQESMSHIWTRSVVPSTLDEAPMAYKPMEEILGHIGDTVEVLEVVKPLYNFKAR